MHLRSFLGRLSVGFAPLLALSPATSAQITLIEEGDALTTVVNGPSLVTRIDDVFVNNNGDWLLEVDTDGATTEDNVILYNGNVLFQEGTSTGFSAPVGTYTFLDTAYLSDSGDVCTLGSVALTAGGTANCVHWNGLLLIEQNVTTIADPNVTPGSVWESISELWGNNTGTLLVGGRTDGARDFIAKVTHDGLGNVTGTTILAIDGQTLPGHPTAIQGFSLFRGRQALNDAGTALWFVDDDHTAPGGSTADDSWIYQDNSPLWREGDAIPLFPASVYGTLSSAEVDLNNNGDYVLQSGRDTSFSLDFIIKNDTTLIAEEGMSLPSIAPFNLTAIGSTTEVFIGDNGDVVWYGDWDDPDTDVDTGIFVNQELVLQEGVSMVNGRIIDTIAATDQTIAVSRSGRYMIVEVFSLDPVDPTFNGAYLYDLTTISHPVGTSYCMANLNSTGFAASISGFGSDVIANNDLVLMASELPQNAFSFFICSQTQGFVANPGGSAGNICLAGSVGRGVGNSIVNSGMTGVVNVTADLTAMPQPTGAVVVMAGETWNFQCWYRDAVGGSATSNFSDGLEVLFQ